LHISICKDTKHVYMSEMVSQDAHDVLNVVLFTDSAVLQCVILNGLGHTVSCNLNDIDPFHDFKPVEVESK
jgi:hypothetical protein